jgi:hypothetical protein
MEMKKNYSNASLGFVSELRNKMLVNNFLFAYCGVFSHEITKSLLAHAERAMLLDKTDIAIHKKVFNVMVECLQNISKHAATENPNNAIFMVGKDNNDHIVYSGNLIKKENVVGLKNKIIALNGMSNEEKSELYKLLISSKEFSSSGGVGLGLLDIAKKSGNKLEFDFIDRDENYTFFSLRTLITI